MKNFSKQDDPCPVKIVRQSQESMAFQINFDQDLRIIPTTRLCFYCCNEGKEHPIEHFLTYPCCGYYICKECMRSNSQCCLECLTKIPDGNYHAILWLADMKLKTYNDQFRKLHLHGRVMVFGCHLFLDELVFLPVYRYKKLEPPCRQLAIMNPTMVERGVQLLEEAVESGIISAMLDLADIYCTNFFNDTFQQDRKKAEQWYIKAAGKGDRLFPLAFTHYGDFLKYERRFKEARNMYQIAATYGHSRGQYEYAYCLLEGIGCTTEDEKDTNNKTITNDNREEALEFLCKVCERGFYAPAYTYLAKVLIKIAEEAYGTVYPVGKSPLPRVLQILKLGKECPYGNSQENEEEISNLIEFHQKQKLNCANCNQQGSDAYPLRYCNTCNSIAYCSKICQKRDFRDGHKFDCCSRKDLFHFQSVRQTLPWVSKAGWKRDNMHMPSLSDGTRTRNLIQMVEDETDEVYGEDDQDYDEYLLRNLMVRMRQNLETFLNREMPHNKSNPILQNQIDSFAKKYKAYPRNKSFIDAMTKMKNLANNAAHDTTLETNRLDKDKCEESVREFRRQKEDFMIYRERNVTSRDVNIPSNNLKNITDTNQIPEGSHVLAKGKKTKDTTKKCVGEGSNTSSDLNYTKKQIEEPDSIDLKEISDRLDQCILDTDIEGIKKIQSEIRGIPGFAKLRKKAKDKLKKFLKDSKDE